MPSMNSPHRLHLIFVLLVGCLSATAPANPIATTTKKSSIALEKGSFMVAKGTKLEIIGIEGEQLLVRFRNVRGRVPLADTDFNPADAPHLIATPALAKEAAPAAAPSAAKPATAPQPAAKPIPPALNTAGTAPQPASAYGKAVQKAKQSAEAHQSTHVDPTKGIMDDK